MCGILGGIAVGPFAFLDEPDRLDAAIDTLAHRGPDDRGKLVTQDHRAFLGHRRLSIIDLAGGQQPITDESDIFDQHRQLAMRDGLSPIDVVQFVDLRMYLPGDILTKLDRTSMACSLECRVPLLDHRITEFSASLSPDLKIRGGVRKYLLKRLAERYVPRELLYRKKMGFRAPIRRWFKRGLLDQTTDLLLDGVLVGQRILDPQGLRWMLRNQRRPWIDFGSQLWALLFLERWARTHLS